MARKFSSKRKVLILSLALLIGLVAYLFSTPDIARLKQENPGKTSFMKYRELEWKRTGKYHRIHQQWVSLSQISPYLIKAVLIAEDDKFWSHEGFDYESMRKALEKDVRARKFKLGGSTISQQLAKNLYLSPTKSLFRKIREAVITWRMERVLKKRRILELYLNVAEWGGRGLFGIGAAAGHYYGKSPAELGPEEAARLAAVLPNPRKYSPVGESAYVLHRAALIYSIMVRRGIVLPEYEEVYKDVAGEDGTISETHSPGMPFLQESPDRIPAGDEPLHSHE